MPEYLSAGHACYACDRIVGMDAVNLYTPGGHCLVVHAACIVRVAGTTHSLHLQRIETTPKEAVR